MKARAIGFKFVKEMPLDRWDKHCHIHATGRVIVYSDGSEKAEFADEDTCELDLPYLGEDFIELEGLDEIEDEF